MSEKQIWTLDELASLTEEVQTKEVEYHGKVVPLQWCELTEGEEPRMTLPDDNASDEEKNRAFAAMASARVLCMVNKANEKNPEGKFLDEEMWSKLPTTLRWKLQNIVLGTGEADKENF